MPIRESCATVMVEALPAVMADPSQLEQVFVNLIGNAIKYRHPDRPPAIHISGWSVGPMVEFAVEDNGIGIEAEYHDRIFEMFRRLHTHDQYQGHRDRPRRRQEDRRAPRREGMGRVDAGRGLDLLLHPAGRVGGRSSGTTTTASISPTSPGSSTIFDPLIFGAPSDDIAPLLPPTGANGGLEVEERNRRMARFTAAPERQAGQRSRAYCLSTRRWGQH